MSYQKLHYSRVPLFCSCWHFPRVSLGWMFQYSAGEENAERLRRRQMRHNTGPERSIRFLWPGEKLRTSKACVQFHC